MTGFEGGVAVAGSGRALAPYGVALAVRDSLYVRGIVLVMLAGGFWSLGGVLVRSVETATEWQIVFIRACALALALLFVLCVRHRSRVIAELQKSGRFAVAGGLCMMVSSIGWIFALTHTSVANAVFILCASPMFAALLGWLLLREPVRKTTWLAMLAALIGIGIMVAGGIRAGALFGNVMAIVSMLAYCGFVVALRHGRGSDMLPAVCLAGMLTAAVAFPFVGDLDVSLRDFTVCATMGVIQIAAGMVLFVSGSRHVPAAELALLSLTEVILAPMWVWLAYGEVPRVLTVAGGSIVLLAIVARAAGGLRRKPPPIAPV